MTHERVVRIITFNLEVDGGPDESGKEPERWRAAHSLLAPLAPDLLLRQEMTYSHLNGNARLHSAERALGMRGFLSPNSAGNNSTGLFIRPSTFQVIAQFEHLQIWRTPPTNIIAWLSGAPGRDIVMCSWHASFNSPRGREREAEELSALADKMKQGKSFIGGGDNNEYPLPDGEKVKPIDWTRDEITDRPHMIHRTNRKADGTRIGCTYIDQTLLGCGLHDPARYAYHDLKQDGALDATAGHAAEGQGGIPRIDRIYLDPRLVKAVSEVRVIDTTGISDHHAVLVDLSYAKAVEALNGRCEPLPPLPIAV